MSCSPPRSAFLGSRLLIDNLYRQICLHFLSFGVARLFCLRRGRLWLADFSSGVGAKAALFVSVVLWLFPAIHLPFWVYAAGCYSLVTWGIHFRFFFHVGLLRFPAY